MTDDEKKQHEKEYQALLALFINLLNEIPVGNKEEALYALSELRSDLAIDHVLKGLNLNEEEAIMLLKNEDDDNLTEHDKKMRKIVIAAVNNLIDFAVCEEYQLYQEVEERSDGEEIDVDSEDYEDYEDLCDKYNDTYAAVENQDIQYAGAMAAWWSKLSASDYVVYWTQNDAKVRPWHMELQGYTAHIDEFPSWMIPPIEYNCRCFLDSVELGSPVGRVSLDSIKDACLKRRRLNNGQTLNVRDALKAKKPKQLSNVYSESLAKYGRIFGKSHPYFQIQEKDKQMLKGFVKRIKEKWYGKS